MTILFIINDAPYGTEKPYNALRLAMALQKEHPETEVRVFLMGDAVNCALPEQNTPQGYYNIERMFKSVIARGGKVKTCGSCVDARGIRNLKLIEDIEISNINQLTQWTVESDKVLTF
jgi:uncharacterized protein involved in oxidation of intracellular sulfur